MTAGQTGTGTGCTSAGSLTKLSPLLNRNKRPRPIRYASTFTEQATCACEWEGCEESGAYPAPASPKRLRERRYFCLEHVRAYNRAWNYYANMTPEQMEQHRRRDTAWQRPTWPFSRGNMGQRQTADTSRNDGKWQRMPVTAEERRAAKELDLDLPYTEDSLKSCYRVLAKAAHPDLNPDEPNAEERFKRLREAYMTLLQPMRK